MQGSGYARLCILECICTSPSENEISVVNVHLSYIPTRTLYVFIHTVCGQRLQLIVIILFAFVVSYLVLLIYGILQKGRLLGLGDLTDIKVDCFVLLLLPTR